MSNEADVVIVVKSGMVIDIWSPKGTVKTAKVIDKDEEEINEDGTYVWPVRHNVWNTIE